MLDAVVWALLVVLGLAVAFDYINGFHDTANAIATSVSTRALRPQYAIALSAVANFVGALIGTAVAATIGEGLIDTAVESQTVIAAALIGAIVWNLITWRAGHSQLQQPRADRRAAGRVFAAAGIDSWNMEGIRDKVLIPLVTSPVIGFLLGLAVMVVIFNVFRRARPRFMNDTFRHLQVVSAGYMALSHGSNDAQKTMGVMTLALLTAGVIDEFVVPIEVKLLAATAISLGTAAGGWRIIKTMGTRVVKLDPVHGFAAETSAATIIFGASTLGMPVSTTHIISSAIMGTGASDRFSADPLGRGPQYRPGLDHHPAGLRDQRRARLPGAEPDPGARGRPSSRAGCTPAHRAAGSTRRSPADRPAAPAPRPMPCAPPAARPGRHRPRADRRATRLGITSPWLDSTTHAVHVTRRTDHGRGRGLVAGVTVLRRGAAPPSPANRATRPVAGRSARSERHRPRGCRSDRSAPAGGPARRPGPSRKRQAGGVDRHPPIRCG